MPHPYEHYEIYTVQMSSIYLPNVHWKLISHPPHPQTVTLVKPLSTIDMLEACFNFLSSFEDQFSVFQKK